MLTVLGMLAEIYIDNLRQETRRAKSSGRATACGTVAFPLVTATVCAPDALTQRP